MAKICFVGNEIAPVTSGGAGALVRDLVEALLAEGHQVVLLLNLSLADFEHFVDKVRPILEGYERCTAYQVDALCHTFPFKDEDFLDRSTRESARYDYACRQVYDLEEPDLIEFVDYGGPAFYALNAKIADLSYHQSHLVVRVHGPVEMIDRYTGYKPINFDRYSMVSLERSSFRLGETVLYPTASFISQYYPHASQRWYGQQECSPPRLASHPKRSWQNSDEDIVLFYGRLNAVKGVDLFVDAAVMLLEQDPDTNLMFYLVGVDSMEPPGEQQGSYQEYLLRRIPGSLRQHFNFTGQLTHAEVEKILLRVRLAAFPSYFESYCLAAHEMRLAGIPIIVSPIPAFHDQFQPDQDAVFFDGSPYDLMRQILRLGTDESLRQRLITSRPGKSAGCTRFYNQASTASWIHSRSSEITLELLVCILEDGQAPELLQRTIASLNISLAVTPRVLRLKRKSPEEEGTQSIHFLGKQYTMLDVQGKELPKELALTRQALLILKAGDEIAPNFLTLGLGILSRQPQVGYVTSWKRIVGPKREWLHTLPLPAMPELAPFEALSNLNRCILRTPVGQPLIDLFDRRGSELGESAYLWQLEEQGFCGICIPAELIRQTSEIFPTTPLAALTYLTLQADTQPHVIDLARYLALLTNTFSASLLPLQVYWAERSGLTLPGEINRSSSIITRPNLRSRVVDRLSRGGAGSQRLLAGLRRIWKGIKPWIPA